jgi:ligand-binding SRPBCC domain-containing protein
MSVGAVGQPRRSAHGGARRSPRRVDRALVGADLSRRSRREFSDVRHPLRPEVRIERVTVSLSGVHVVTSLPSNPGATAGAIAPPGVVWASHTAADLVAALLPPRYRDRVRPVLCSTDEVAIAELVDDVLVTSPGTLEYIVTSSPPVLSTSEVNDVGLRLDARLEPFPVPGPSRRRRWRRRHTVATAVVAACSAAAAAVVAHEVGGAPLPW